MEEFPSNSFSSQTNRPEKSHDPRPGPRLKVVREGASLRKKPVGARFVKFFLSGESFQSAVERVLVERVTPLIRDLILDSIRDIFEDVVGGGRSSGGPRTYSGSPNRTPYSDMGSSSRSRGSNSSSTRHGKAHHNFDDIEFRTIDDAEEVLENIMNMISEGFVVTLADFYQSVHLTATPQDENWGWKHLSEYPKVIRKRSGQYVIDLPRPVPLGTR